MSERLQLNSEPLDMDRIETARQNGRLGHKAVLFKSTASTNDIAWKYAANPDHDGLCVLAESQTAGRGRRGRTWHDNPGQSITASVLLLNSSIPAELLTLTAAVAVVEAIQKCCNIDGRIKWPNDILINGKKVAGILVEQKTAEQKRNFVVGIGINCTQQPEFFRNLDLAMPATSLTIETGSPVDRTKLVCTLLAALEHWLQKAHNSLMIINRWQQHSDLLGRHLVVESDTRRYSGFCRGIDPVDGLIVQLDTGPVRIFSARQTSIVHVRE